MPSYQYQALRLSDRQRQTGVIEAENERLARERLRELDLITLDVKPVKGGSAVLGGGKSGVFGRLLGLFGKVNLKDRISFSKNLSTMLKAGIPITDALHYLDNYSKKPAVKSIMSQLRNDLLNGLSFSQALSRYPSVFNEVYVNVMRAGESSGELEQTLDRMVHQMIREDKLKGKVISVAIYPAMVIGVLLVVMAVMFLFIMPTFEDIYKKMDMSLPMITQFMFGISKLLRVYWFISFPVLFVGTFLGIRWLRSGTGREWIDRWLMRIPFLKELVQYLNVAGYISTLQVSFSAGLPITEGIPLALKTVGHTLIRRALAPVGVAIQGGQKIATALGQSQVMPPMVMIMLATGEESGELDNMLANANDYLEEEIQYRVDILASLIEPVLLIFLGLVVGVLALSIYLPMFNLYDAL